jgi:hypothetical protein
MKIESEPYDTTDGQSASLSWNKATTWGLLPDFYYCQTVAGLLMWGAVSDERTDLSFKIAAGPRQHSLSRVRVPWISRPYFTVSVLRLTFSSPPTTRRVTRTHELILLYNSGRTEERPLPPTVRALHCYSVFIRCYKVRVNLAAMAQLSHVYKF